MRLLCLAVVASFLGGTTALAQPNPEPKDGKLTIPLTLHPTAAPKPLSRYYLTPQYIDMQPGNRVPGFMKAYMEQHTFFSKEPADQREKWNQTPLADLPLDDIKKSGCVGGLLYRKDFTDFTESAGRPLSDVDEAARLLHVDWQVWFNIRRDGIGTLLPEVQKMRELASVLKVRMRYEIKTGDFDKAAYSARTFYGLGSALAEHPTLICLLVAAAVETIGLNAVEEMIAQPGCPNLYWSLTEIPAEVFSSRLASQGERVIIHAHFKSLVDNTVMSDADAKAMAETIDRLTRMIGPDGKAEESKFSERFAKAAADEKKVAAFRQELIAAGRKADAVNKFPPLQVVMAHNLLRYDILLDEFYRLMTLPHADAMKLAAEAEAKLQADADAVLAKQLLPTITKVKSAMTRTQQRVAYLRVVEAVRLYAHDNGGKLPEKLADIKLPLPLDPVTGKEFSYAVKDGVATLTGGNPNPDVTATNRVYELRVKK